MKHVLDVTAKFALQEGAGEAKRSPVPTIVLGAGEAKRSPVPTIRTVAL